MSKKLINLTNRRFGKLIVIKKDFLKKFPSGQEHWRWICLCDCGGNISVDGSTLRQGLTRSCRSCYSTNHPRYKELYNIWCGMMNRCYNKNNIGYKNYGGRGITVCERWKDFSNFAKDMPPKLPNTSVDRVNNNGNYEPNNVRWATQKEQMHNTRRTIHDEFNRLEGMVSRQRILQLRWRRDDRCTICGKKRNRSKFLCDGCYLKRYSYLKHPFSYVKS